VDVRTRDAVVLDDVAVRGYRRWDCTGVVMIERVLLLWLSVAAMIAMSDLWVVYENSHRDRTPTGWIVR
jgi:hypothetical protein